jgi:predicted secreted protein
MTEAISAFGTLLKIGDGGSPENFTTIAEVKDISLPHFARDMIDVTTHSSTEGWREFMAGLKSGGEVTFEINFLPTDATHSYAAGLLHDLEGGTLRNFKVVLTDAGNTTWTFAAIVSDFTPKAPVAGALTAAVTLKLSGKPTLA